MPILSTYTRRHHHISIVEARGLCWSNSPTIRKTSRTNTACTCFNDPRKPTASILLNIPIMTSQPPVGENARKSVSNPPSFFRARSAQIRAYISKRRRWLCAAVVLVIVGMIIGIIFAAHKYFVELGGQGFLKAREESPSTVYLPQRQIRRETQGRGNNVPYYICGDQLDSCDAYELSHVCCPVNTYCHRSALTLSGIVCCNSTSPADCGATKQNPPQCPKNTFECSVHTGGGCCKTNTICTPNGCIKIIGPSIISEDPADSKTSNSEEYSSVTTIMNGNAAKPTGLIITTTVTERPAATATEVKQGEVAQSGQPHQHAMFTSPWLPYLLTFSVVLMALLMGYL